MVKIRAAVFRDQSLKPSIEDLELDGPGEGEVLVRIVATGVCHTDLMIAGPHGWSPRPVVLGHEGAGVVEAVGRDVTDLAKGDHVVMTFTSCGHCPSCQDGEPAYCSIADHFACTRPDGSHYLQGKDGPVHGDFFNQSSFATYALGKQRGIVKVRQDAPLKTLAPLGCGMQTGAGAVLNVFKMQPGQTLVVFGTGSLGLAAVMAAKIAKAGKIIAVDLHENRLALASELGAHEVIHSDGTSVSDRILEILPDGADFTFDTTGVKPVMRDAIDTLAHRGTFGFAAPPPDGSELSIPMKPLMKGRKIVGIIEGNSNPDVFLPQLVDFYMDGKFPLDKMINYYPFDDIEQAFHDSHAGTTVKPVLVMD